MKMIVAVIKPEQLPAVKQALFDAEIRHMTATSVMGTAPRTEQQMFRGVKKEVSLLKRVRLELAVNDAVLERAIEAITGGCMETGGWGKIFVSELHDVVTVWTGERGSRALY
ncbi:MAG: P-II family nitrogen regulator [Gemmatimonadales bacterium]|jgi:nitrogen regulatory protein PII|nr:MAG: P-II family nitrogen regulator [Gemmatimonadales bacterium]